MKLRTIWTALLAAALLLSITACSRPGPAPAAPPGDSAEQGAQPGTAPGAQPGTAPGAQPGTAPGAQPGTAPGPQPGTVPGAQPGAGSDTQTPGMQTPAIPLPDTSPFDLAKRDPVQLSAAGQWSETADPPSLTLSGITNLPSVYLAVKQGDSVKRQETIPVHDGWYSIDLGSPTDTVIVLGGPDKQELRRLTLGPERHGGPSFFAQWSPHFSDVWVRQVAPGTITVDGRSTGWEGKFLIEIKSAGRRIGVGVAEATNQMPAQGRFSTVVYVPEGVPQGAEAHFVVPTGQNGMLQTDLVLKIGQ